MSADIETGANRPTTDKPRVWVLQGHRAGDNHQLQALADGLGWATDTKNLIWQKNLIKRLPVWTPLYGRTESLRHLTPQAKEALHAPWPDVVLSVGWRSVPVARWIKAQCGAKLVHIGRPRAPLSSFDLVLTTPQYRLPPTNNVLQLAGPLTKLSPQTLAAAAMAWEARLAHLPRPWTAVLVGGDTPTLTFPTSSAAILASSAVAAANGGSLLVLTSPRTSQSVTKALRDAVPASAFFHPWVKGTDNAYTAVLALADRFIVTNDSISMTHEAALTGQPLEVFPLRPKERGIGQALRSFDQKMRHADTPLAKTYLGLIRNGMIYSPKSPDDYFQQLALGGDTPAIEPQSQSAVRAVRALFDLGAKQVVNMD